jgi:hypothetical protein
MRKKDEKGQLRPLLPFKGVRIDHSTGKIME